MYLRKVESERDVELLSQMAIQIFREYFPDLIGSEQTEYMTSLLFTPEAINRQRQSGMHYYFAEEEQAIGFTALRHDDDALFISKFYLTNNYRNKGLGRDLFNHVLTLAEKTGFSKIRLRVFRGNQMAIDFYRKTGFLISREIQEEIGNGFVLDDYEMELTIS